MTVNVLYRAAVQRQISALIEADTSKTQTVRYGLLLKSELEAARCLRKRVAAVALAEERAIESKTYTLGGTVHSNPFS